MGGGRFQDWNAEWIVRVGHDAPVFPGNGLKSFVAGEDSAMQEFALQGKVQNRIKFIERQGQSQAGTGHSEDSDEPGLAFGKAAGDG